MDHRFSNSRNQEYLDVKHVTLRKRNRCFTNCDDGIDLGDEVITADFTFAATVEVIALLQLTRFS
jgi:dTDP-4-amino-4,6-dideoxygalactose transaminase